jgi:hypothetical protein
VKRAIAIALVLLCVTSPLAAQTSDPATLWRAMAERIEAGTTVTVRLQNGRRFNATLVQAAPDALLLQPKTRVPVPVQPVPYGSIASLERKRDGIGAGKAAAIGVATGVGAFFATMLVIIAAIDD